MAQPNLGAPLDHTRAGAILRGVQTWDLDQHALLDKIINIKFTRRSGKYFTLRSDYEVKVSSDGQPYFIPITQKPSIRVSYKQVSNDTSIQVDVRVTNLYFDNENTDNTIFTNTGDPITKLDIQMGYRRQFPDWTSPPLAYDDKESADPANAANRLKMFYELATFQTINALEQQDTGLMLSVQVLSTHNEGNPPDRITTFQCIVGAMDYGFRWTLPGAELREYFEKPTNFPADTEYTQVEKLFFTYMTCRFFRPGVTYRIYDSRRDPAYDQTREDLLKVEVFDYDAEKHKFIDSEEQRAKTIEKRWTEIPMSGVQLLNPEDAALLGVAVNVTDRVRQMSRENVVATTVPNEESGAVHWAERFQGITFQEREGAQMIEIQTNIYPDIRWYRQMNGDFFVYHKDEAIEEVVRVLDSDRKKNVGRARTLRPLLLPAIYDVTFSGTRTIRCPFISLISPGQQVGFAAKYNISDIVGYFYPHGKDMWFLVIIADVEFDTDGETNMMTLMCVDTKPPSEALLANQQEPSVTDAQEEQRKVTVTRALEWRKRVIDSWITQRGQKGAITTWDSFASIVILNNPAAQGIDGVPKLEEHPTYWAACVAALNWWVDQEDNNSILDANLKRRGPATGLAFLKNLGMKRDMPELGRGDEYNFPFSMEKVEDAG